MNKEERNALISFLAIYIVSAMVLVSIIAMLYYKKEIVAIQDRCSIEMSNTAMNVEKELMNAQMSHKEYTFKSPSEAFQIGLFNSKGEMLYSNLSKDDVLLSQRAYKSNTHEYHVETLDMPSLGVKYIVVEGQEGATQRVKLLILIWTVILFSAVFIGFVGYFLSKLLMAPIKERMNKLNAFIKDSSHELNTPVSALMMSVSSLRTKKSVDSRILNHISISAKLISQIYNSLSFIAFNDKDEVYNENFNLAELVRESVKFFDEIAANRGNTIKCDLEETPLFMDRSRIQKVINNLLSNALKYSYSNSEIQVELKNRVFTITNKGEGIQKGEEQSIFERFERRNKDVGGFGIGLDIVKTVCKYYGIEVQVNSIPNEKTTFTLLFPSGFANPS